MKKRDHSALDLLDLNRSGMPDAEDPSGPGSSGSRPAFQPGEVIGERFVIESFLAAGGMGEVYEAEDLELEERVALKTVRPDIAREAPFLERFRREIHMARQVTHPNVCRVFDLFRHQTPEGQEILFLTMELLEGESLEKHLYRVGRMAPPVCLELLRQMASALDAAHAAGIIHRDFKPANVVLVPPRRPGDSPRAVVTDFGLARSRNPVVRRATPSMTEKGLLVGSASYMAPEQAEGKETTPATDIYALGLVTYEMLTDALPHSGDGPIAVLLDRLTNSVVAPSRHVPDLPREWDDAILRCLDRDPLLRFKSARDFVDALTPPSVSKPLHQTSTENQPRGRSVLDRWIQVAAGVFLLATLIGALTLAVRRVQPHGSPLAVSAPLAHPRRAVAVLGFKNLSAKRETAWISTALAEMLTTELAAGEAFRLVPGESIARFRIETGFPDTESFSPDTLSRIRSNLGSELVVVGSYFAVGSGTLRLDLRLQDTSSGDIVTAVSEEGTEAELPALVSRLGGRLRQSLGTAGLSPAQASAVTASLPSSTKAVRLYAEGVAHLRVFEARQARDHLLEAAEADPKSPLVHSALAEAWGRLGYGLKARDAAKRSFDLSSSLSREERLLVEGRYQQMAMDWVKAEATFRTLSNLYPDSLEHGLRHAWAQASSGKPREALETVDNLRKRSPSFSGDPRLDLLEAEIAELASDFPREKAAAARSAEKATALRARLLLAPSNLKLAIALSRLGEKEASQKAFLEARRDFAEAKDRRGFAEVLTESAFVLGQDGRLLEAKQLTEEALATYRDIGDRFGEGRALRGLGILTYNHGDIGQARKYFERAVTVSVEIGDRARESASRNNLAIALREQGELEAALEQLAAAQKYLDESQSNSKRFPTLNLAEVLAARGDLSGALRAYQESLSAFQSTGEKRGTAYSLAGLGTVLFEQGDLEAARAKHEEALGIWEEIGERWASAPSRVALARIAFERRRFSDAENLARRASEDSAHQEAMANELVARALLMEILAEQKKSAAVQEKPRVEELAAEIDHPRARLRGQLHVARAMLLLGKSREALGILEKVCSETSRRGFAVLRIECRLVTAEAGLSSGHAVETRARLLELKREASEMGFTRLARRALRLGEPNP